MCYTPPYLEGHSSFFNASLAGEALVSTIVKEHRYNISSDYHSYTILQTLIESIKNDKVVLYHFTQLALHYAIII